MSQATTIVFGSVGEICGPYIVPPPPTPTGVAVNVPGDGGCGPIHASLIKSS
jgi:hypothetical protein